MHDRETDPQTTSDYECLECGEIVSAESRPGECPSCGEGGSFRNRAMSPE